MQNAACIDLTTAARSVQRFRINGFTATKESLGLPSRACSVGGHSWRIEFDPDGRNSGHVYFGDPWVTFRATLTSKAHGAAASFSCCLVDPVSMAPDPSTGKLASSSFYKNSGLNIALMARSDLEASKYLKDDCVIVQCVITVLLAEPKDATTAAAAAYASPRVPSADLHQQLGDLLRSGTGADITFIVAGESVTAHRSVLAARSPVFMAELFGDMKEKASQCVEIEDMEAEVFRAMLRFIYTDTVPELGNKMKGEQATAMAQHLLEAADRYGLKRLKKICVEKICTTMNVDTVATTLALAEQHGCSKLKARCMKFTLANLSAVSATEGYKHLEASCPSVLTELLKLMLEGYK
ncbi:hypothetical protein SETIT_4G267600v2 [Setaria italica]|uniref:BTB domain-containing protein n=1 Tax=Setaria italica TaxID=4555 RepID=A0A368QYM4_SETIT|nr:BTB/POZ and MATH domain-containing protein 1 [Setaria italica]RCV23045.1 hypothetical protein SETIT_4G267600v2 [Setaria italica]